MRCWRPLLEPPRVELGATSHMPELPRSTATDDESRHACSRERSSLHESSDRQSFFLEPTERLSSNEEEVTEPEPPPVPPPRTLAARGRRWAADLWVVAPSCHWLLGLALLHGGVCISCGALQFAAGQPDGELAEDGSDAWLLSDTDAAQLTQATLRICALALVLGGLCVGAMVAVGLAYEAPHELYAAAALGVWLTLTALLMPTDAADHPSHLPLALALLLLGLSLATLDACRRVHRSFGPIPLRG